jgi:hypothetical protein
VYPLEPTTAVFSCPSFFPFIELSSAAAGGAVNKTKGKALDLPFLTRIMMHYIARIGI